jgi:hypothetical protein
MKYTMCRKRGVSTILGTIIFIGILFSAFAPMMLTIRQADAYYELQKHEVTVLDDEKSREDLTFYVYPDVSDDLIVSVENHGAMNIEVVRIWINNKIQPESSVIQSMNTTLFGPYDVNPIVNDIFSVRVTTKRGNVFESSSGNIEYGSGGWVVESKIINVMISASGIVFKIYLYKWEDSSWVEKDWGQVWKIGGTAFKPFEVSEYGNGEYRVVVKRGSSTIHDEEDLMMEWPDGPSTLWVYA